MGESRGYSMPENLLLKGMTLAHRACLGETPEEYLAGTSLARNPNLRRSGHLWLQR